MEKQVKRIAKSAIAFPAFSDQNFGFAPHLFLRNIFVLLCHPML